MPTLLVLRHGAAQSVAGRDHERALTARGRSDAAVAGRALAAVDPPDRALVSSARRAHDTFAAASEHGGWQAPVEVLDELYGGGAHDVISAIAAHGGPSRTLLVVGHEPWCSSLVELLTGARVRMETGSLASVAAGPSWDALDPQWCSLQWFASPRVLAGVAAPPAAT